MIIDAHCHAGPGDGFTGPWDTRASLHKYRVRAARAGIQKTVIFAAFSTDYRVANREVAKLVCAAPERYIGFAFVHAERDRGRIGLMVREADVPLRRCTHELRDLAVRNAVVRGER